MVKQAGRVKERDLGQQFQGALRGLVAGVPFLKLVSLKSDARLGEGGDRRADWLVELRAGEEAWTLIAETKRNGQPREVRAAVLQVKDYLSLLPNGKSGCGLVIAPFISEQSAQICKEAGIGYVDLAGNALLSFGRVFVEKRVAGNPVSVKREARSVFSPKATRVIRQLLQGPLRAWKVKELAEAAEVSIGHGSAVRKKLLQREWAVEDEDGLMISDPDALLDAWVQADDWGKRTEIREYSLLQNNTSEVASQVVGLLAGKKYAFTQWFGAFLRQPYTLPVLTTVYVEDFPDEETLKRQLGARRVDGGGRLRIVRPTDEGVFQCLQEIQGRKVVCDVQLYLDVIAAGLRGDEAAAELRGAENFSGGWK